jgi:hypothetical protein
MDTLDYRRIVRSVLYAYAQLPYANGNLENMVVADTEGDHYLLLIEGWDGERRVHSCLVHIDIINGKLWIQRDNTEDGIALDLEAAGVPKDHIVLGFRSAEVRPYTDYAVV